MSSVATSSVIAITGVAGMSNVLDNDTQQHILALGPLGWSLLRIEALAVRPETISG
jgi:hypothetical protein